MQASFITPTVQCAVRIVLIFVLLLTPVLTAIPNAQAAAQTATPFSPPPAVAAAPSLEVAEQRFHAALNRLINTPADADGATQATVQREMEAAAADYEQAQLAHAARQPANSQQTSGDGSYLYTANAQAKNGDTADWTLLGKPTGDSAVFDQAFNQGLSGTPLDAARPFAQPANPAMPPLRSLNGPLLAASQRPCAQVKFNVTNLRFTNAEDGNGSAGEVRLDMKIDGSLKEWDHDATNHTNYGVNFEWYVDLTDDNTTYRFESSGYEDDTAPDADESLSSNDFTVGSGSDWDIGGLKWRYTDNGDIDYTVDYTVSCNTPLFADLQSRIDLSSAQVPAGNSVVYTFYATNNGRANVDDATIDITLPSGLSNIIVTPSQGSGCGPQRPIFSCAMGAIPANGNATVTVQADTPANQTGNIDASMAARIVSTGSQTDPDGSNNGDTQPLMLEPKTDTAVTLSGPVAVQRNHAGTTTYEASATITNNGPTFAPGVRLTPTLPAGISVQSAVPTSGSCQSNGICTLGDMGVGATASINYTLIVDQSVLEGASFAIQLAVAMNPASGSATEIDSLNNTAAATTRLTYWGISFGQTGPGAGIEALSLIGGSLYAGGTFGIKRWDGSAWSTIGSGGPTGTVHTIVSDGASGLYVGGDFTNIGPRLAHWNGSGWSGVGTGGANGTIYALAHAGSDLYVGGAFSQIDALQTNNVARWDGANWNSLGVAGVTQGFGAAAPQVRAIAVDGDNVYVAGLFKVPAANIARWQKSSNAWAALGSGINYPGGNSVVHDLALLDGRVYVGGRFTTAGGLPAGRIAAWDPAKQRWLTLGSGLGGTGTLAVNALAVADDELLVGGTFTTAGGGAAKHLARWNGASWTTLGNGADGSPIMAVASGGSPAAAVVGGTFTSVDGNVAAAGIARYVYEPIDLAINETLSPSSPVAGEPLAIQLTVSNLSARTARNVVIRNELPSSATYLSATGATCNQQDGIVTCTLGQLNASATANITLNTTIAPVSSGAFLNRAWVGATQHDTSPANNRTSSAPAVVSQADLAASLTGPASVVAGESLSYAVSATNAGPASAANAILTLTLPTGGASLTNVSGLDCVPTSDYADMVEIVCQLGSLSVNQTVAGTLDFATTAESNGTINATLTASSALTDPQSANNSQTVATTVAANADLAITLIGPRTIYLPSPLIAPFRYRLTAKNDGPSLARDTTVTLNLPTATTFVAAPAGCANTGQTVVCVIGDLEPAEATNLSIDLYVNAGTAHATTLVASASVTAQAVDPDSANNSGATTATITTSIADATIDLNVAQNAPSTVVAGETAMYSLEIFNQGAVAASVTVTDTLPADTTFDPSLSDPRCFEAINPAGTVVCVIDELIVGDVQELAVATSISSTTAVGTSIENGAVASASVAEANFGDNSASHTATVETQADLELIMTGSHISVGAGETVTMTLDIINLGPSAAQELEISNPQPDGMVLQSAEPSQGSCEIANDQVDCELGSLDVDQAASIEIVLIAGSGTVTNVATLQSSTPDLDETNNTAEAGVEIAAAERTSRTFGVIEITADTFVDLDSGATQAFGDVWLGETLYLAGETDSIVIDEEDVSGEGTLAYRQEQLTLFTGDFTGTLSLEESILTPAEDVEYQLGEISGFHLADVLIAQVDLESGRTDGPASELDIVTEGFSETLTINFYIEPGPVYGGTIESFEFTVGEIEFAVEGATLNTEGVGADSVAMTLPAEWGGIETTVTDLSITSDGISIGGASANIPLPDFDLAGDKVQISDSSVTIIYDGSDLILVGEGTVAINLPDNEQESQVSFSIDTNGEFSAEIDTITLNLASASLELSEIAVSNAGLSVAEGVLTLPPSLNESTVTVSDVTIAADGIEIGGAVVEINLPDINIGNGSKVRFSEVVATLGIEGDTYFFGISAVLQLRLPQNNQDITIAATVDSDGQFSGSVSQISLTIANATLTMVDLTFDNTGLQVSEATIQLPAALGGGSGSLYELAIGQDGLSIGGGSVRFPFPDIKLGGATGFAVTNIVAELAIAADRSFKMTLGGTVQINARSVRATAAGTISVDSQGRVSGTIAEFNITVAGMNITVKNAKVNNGELSVAEASMKTPASWGGAEIAVYNLRISSSGVRIGGGRFAVPNIKIGSVSLGSLSGELREEGSGYVISLAGKFRIAGLGGPNCMLGVGATVYVSSSGSTVLDLTAFDTTAQAPNGVELRYVQVGLTGCRIPLGQTGFFLTRVQGSLTLTADQTVIDLGISIANQGDLVRGDADMRIQFNPWQIDFAGSITLFSIFKAAELKAKVRSNYFSADLKVRQVWPPIEGQVSLTAWSTDGTFHLVGRATVALVFEEGSIWEECFISICISIPPFSLRVAEIGAEFGEFHKGSGTVWGLKGWAQVLSFRAGFYVDVDGGLDVGNVDGYRLITPPDIARMRSLAQNKGLDQSTLSAAERDMLDHVTFSGDDVIISQTVATPTDLMFVLSGRGTVPTLSLIAPDGTVSTPATLAGGIEYVEAPVDGAIQRLYVVKQAAAGVWQAVIGAGSEEYIFQALGASLPPTLSNASVVNTSLTSAQVSWQLSAPVITTTLDVFVTPGPITATHTITDTSGNLKSLEVPVYSGEIFQQNVATARNGSPSSLDLDLSELPSGTYWVWLKADDQRNPAQQLYAPTPIMVAHPWQATWTADIQDTDHPRGVDLSWSRHPNPDVDYYSIEVSTKTGVVERIEAAELAYSIDNLTPGKSYSITLVGMDEATGRTSRSESLTIIATGSTFALAAAQTTASVVAGQSFQVPLTIQAVSGAFSDQVRLSADTLPDGFNLSFDTPENMITPTLNGTAATAYITTTASMVGGTYQVAIEAQGEGIHDAVVVNVTVKEPQIVTSITPAALTFDGTASSLAINLTATSLEGATGGVDLDLLDAPPGLIYRFSANQLALGDNITLALTDTARLENGTYALRIRAEAGFRQQYIPVALMVRKPDFQLEPSLTRLSIVAGEQAVFPIAITGESLQGTAELSLATRSTPVRDGVVGFTTRPTRAPQPTLNAPIDGTAYLIFESERSLSPGTYRLIVEGRNGGNVKSVEIEVTVFATAIGVDLSVSQTAASVATIIGGRQTYTLEVINYGPLTADQVVITDTLPVLTTAVSATPSRGTCAILADQVVCNLYALRRGARAQVTIVAEISPELTPQTDLVNQAEVSSAQTELNPADNLHRLLHPSTAQADLAVSIATESAQAVAGSDLTYRIVAWNNGQSLTAAVRVGVTLPAELELLAVVADQGACQTSADSRGLSCLFDQVGVNDSNDSAVITLRTRVKPSARQPLQVAATIAGPLSDADQINNQASSLTPVRADVNLAIAHVAVAPAQPIAGADLTYQLVVSNSGQSDATSVVVRDQVPAQFTEIDSVSATQGSCTISNQEVVCELGTLAPQATATVTLRGIIDPATRTAIYNTATASSDMPETIISDNRTSAETTVAVASDLSITIISAQPTAFQFVVNNLGASNTRTAVVSATLSPSVTIDSVLPSQGTCSVTGTTFTCQLGALSAKDQVVIGVRTQVAPGIFAVEARGQVAGSEYDPRDTNNRTRLVSAFRIYRQYLPSIIR